MMIITSKKHRSGGNTMQLSNLVTVRVTSEVAHRLQKFSDFTDRSKSYVAAEAIEEYLDIHEWQIKAIKEGIAAAKRGKVKDFDEVKKYWEKKFEDNNN
jgi:RHH-type transcriptional regulator, rel operon repressor / antitoxin RelB